MTKVSGKVGLKTATEKKKKKKNQAMNKGGKNLCFQIPNTKWDKI